MPKDGAVLQAALYYAKIGWQVVPLHHPDSSHVTGCSCIKPDCDSPGKHPRTEHGLKDASTNPGIITGWWKKWPQANVGIVCGKKSGLVVVDIDCKTGPAAAVQKALEAKGKGAMPYTVMSDTGGGGFHFLLSYNGIDIRNTTDFHDIKGVDIRGEGGYIVAPPSLHVSGEEYRWRIKPGGKIAPIPDWLKKLFVEKKSYRPPADKTVLLGEWGKLWSGVETPGRNNTAARLAGRLLGRGISREEVIAILTVWNKANTPPLNQSELIQTINSINRSEEAKPDKIGAMPAEYFLTADIARPDNIVDKGIFPVGSGMMLTGESGAGKSLISLEIGVRIAKGMPLWEYEVPEPRTILYIQKENSEYSIKVRLKRICRGLGVQYPDNIFFADRKFKINLTSVPDMRKVKELVEKLQAKVVILDPLSSYHSVNENDNIQMRRVLDNLTDLSGETGCAWIVVHHEGKPGLENNRLSKWRFRGASSIRDWADTMIGYIVKPNNEGKVMRLLTFDKVRNGPQPTNLLFERDENFIHHVIEETSAVPMSYIAEALSDLGGRAKNKTELFKKLQEFTEASKATIYRAIEAAENRVWFEGESKELISLVKV